MSRRTLTKWALLAVALMLLFGFAAGYGAPTHAVGPKEGEGLAPPFREQPPKPARPGISYPEVIDPDPVVQDMIDQVSTATITQYTGDLSGEWPVIIGGEPYTIQTRHTYSGVPIQKATQLVAEHMTDLGLPVEYHTWQASAPPNVIGEITGAANPDDIFIIMAHLDDMPSYGLAPGADDNASGSVAVMLAADILSQYQWDCTLRFAFWTGEEQYLLGSYAYAERSYNLNENILGALNLDMIAWNTTGSSPDIDLHAKSTIPATMALAQLYADVISAYNIDLIPQIISNGTGASDHASFWQFGYPAILGIEDYYGGGDFNPYYHSSQDTLAHLNMDYYTEFVRASIGTFAHMTGCLAETEQGTVAGQVTSAADGLPISGADVEAGGTMTATNPSGYYTMTLPAGAYSMTVSADGFLPVTRSVTIISNVVTIEDFSLQPVVEEGMVTGQVTAADDGLPITGALVTADAYTATTDISGLYTLTLPTGAYSMTVTAAGYEPAGANVIVEDGQVIEMDFALTRNVVMTPTYLPLLLYEP